MKSNDIYTFLTSGRFHVIILAVDLALRIPRLVEAPLARRIVGNSQSLVTFTHKDTFNIRTWPLSRQPTEQLGELLTFECPSRRHLKNTR